MLAPALVAGQPEVIIGRHRAATGRVEYDCVVPLEPVPPDRPAALRMYNNAGSARVLWLDFDPGRAAGGQAAVTRDATAAAQLVRAHGGLVIEDTTRRGGRHVIVPLAAPVHRCILEPILRALADRYPTLDISPSLNVTRGSMAPPGALTRRGERRQLLTPLADARTAVLRRSTPGLIDALRAHLRPTDTPDADPAPGRRQSVVDERAVAVPGGARPLPALARGIAERGIYPTDRYPSGSEARQAALVAAAGRGWCLADVLQHVAAGAWPGLAQLYAKYGTHLKKALTADWAKALLYATERPKRSAVPQANTRGRTTSRGAASRHNRPQPASNTARDEHRFLRRAYGALMITSREWARDEHGWTRLAVLLAGIAHAHRTGSRHISPGTRSLTLIAGLMNHSTIAAVLRAEHEDPDGWFRLTEAGHGDRPDRYELVIPDRYAAVMDHQPLPTGRLQAAHPIFAPGLLAPGVGLAAWQVIDSVAAGADAVPAITEATGVSRAHAYRVLRAARQAGLLAQRADGTWRRTRRSLDRAGRHIGLTERIGNRRAHYEIQRRLWRTWLASQGRHHWRAVDYHLVAGRTAVPTDVPLWLPGWDHWPPPNDPDPPGRTPATGAVHPRHGPDMEPAVRLGIDPRATV